MKKTCACCGKEFSESHARVRCCSRECSHKLRRATPEHIKETAARLRRKPRAILRNTWGSMIRRCHNPNNKQYKDYGGRGIVVCERWRTSFDDFCADVGERPPGRYSLDRIDNNRGYEPGNVRWATSKVQLNNTRYNLNLTAFGVTRTASEWADVTGLGRELIYYRIREGWSHERAVGTPSKKYNRRKPADVLDELSTARMERVEPRMGDEPSGMR